MPKPTKKAAAAAAQTAPVVGALVPVNTQAGKTLNVSLVPDSLRALGYQTAVYADGGKSLAQHALTLIADPENVPEDDAKAIKEGILQRKSEITPAVWYRREGRDQYVKLDSKPEEITADVLSLSVDYAFSYTGQEVGALKKEQPNLHGMVMEVRKAGSKYVSNVYAALLGMIRRAKQDAAGSNGRGATKSFYDKCEEVLAALLKSNAAAAKRGDSTALDPALLKRKIAAFHATK